MKMHKQNIAFWITLILSVAVDGRPQDFGSQNSVSTCTVNGKSGRLVAKSECWRCMVLPNSFNLRGQNKEPEYDEAKTTEWCNESEDVVGRNDCSSDADCLEMGRKLCDIDPKCFGIAWYEHLLEQPLKLCRSKEMEPKGDGWHAIMKKSNSDVGQLTCLASSSLGTRSSEDEEEDTVCCPDEEIKHQCTSNSLSRCVQESVCKNENKPSCAASKEASGKDKNSNSFGTRSDADEFDDYDDRPINQNEESCPCSPPQSVQTLMKTNGLTGESFVCCNNVLFSPLTTCEDGFKLVPQSKCAFSTRLALAFEEQIEEKEVCCPLRDVITCDPNGFRMVPESQCSIRVRSGGLWEDVDEAVISKREGRSVKEVCCALEDVFESKEEVIQAQPCDEGYRCVPSVECKKSSDNMDLLKGRGSLGVRQDSETSQQPCIPEDSAQDGNDFICCSNR